MAAPAQSRQQRPFSANFGTGGGIVQKSEQVTHGVVLPRLDAERPLPNRADANTVG
jgi:hypothetical protein